MAIDEEKLRKLATYIRRPPSGYPNYAILKVDGQVIEMRDGVVISVDDVPCEPTPLPPAPPRD